MSEGSLDQDPQNYGLPLATNQLALTLHVASIRASVGRRHDASRPASIAGLETNFVGQHDSATPRRATNQCTRGETRPLFPGTGPSQSRPI